MQFLTPGESGENRWKGVELEGNTKVLMSSLPDRETLARELGYRAEDVAGLTD